MKEIWKDVVGYEGLYQVSNLGIVRNYKTLKEVKTCQWHKGYERANLFKDNQRKGYYVHRLVAQAFIPNPKNLPIVNHKNEISTDNRVENLEWCDSKYNLNYKDIHIRKHLSIAICYIKKNHPEKLKEIKQLEQIKQEFV